MTEYDRTNTFTLGKGDKLKEEHQDKDTSKWPDYKGQINIDGTEYYLSAWIQTNGKTGEKFFSGQVKPKEAAVKTPTDDSPPNQGFDDDIPF